MDGEHLTPKKITKILGNESEIDSDDSFIKDLSGESEVFDSDKDPDYTPGDDDIGHYKPSRLFELRFQRQLDTNQVAGTSGAAQICSDDDSYPPTPKKSKKRKLNTEKNKRNVSKKNQKLTV